MDQPKLERLLRLMKMLTANTLYSIQDISDKLDISVRTVYRYIDTFRNAGFVVKRKGDCVQLDKSSPYFKDISELIHFTEEEAYILKSAIESIDENNILKQNLKKKLYTVYDYHILAETVVNTKNARNVNNLVEAMEKQRQVMLRNYSSAHGSDIRDRRVEPFAFTTNYVQVWCYDVEEKANKLFKTSRIGSVEVSDDEWMFADAHRSGFIDIFRISSDVQYPVKLRLTLRAASLLMEEYPLSAEYLQKISDNDWLLSTSVCSFEGIGRFVMGLAEDVVILESEQFREFIHKKVNALLDPKRPTQ